MEHELVAEHDAVVRRLEVAVGDTVDEGQLLAELADATPAGDDDGPAAAATPDGDSDVRPDLEQVRHRHQFGLDAAPARSGADAATTRTVAPPARTSPTWSTRAHSSSTAR